MNESYGTRSLREIFRILFQHALLLFLIVLIGGAGTYIVCEFFAPRQYRSQIHLIYKRPQNRSPLNADVIGEKALEVFVKTQQQIVMSDIVLARALVISEDEALRKQWYDLRAKWEKAGGLEKGEGARSALMSAHDGVRQFFAENGAVAKKVDELLNKKQEAFEEFHKNIKLETPGGEQVAMTESFGIRVDRPGDRLQSDSHLLAMYAADILADMYIIRYQELQEKMNAPSVRVMGEVVDNFANTDVREASEAYSNFIQKNADKIGVLEQLMKSGTEHGIQVVLTKIKENAANLHMDLARDKSVYEVLSKTLPPKAMQPGGVDSMTDDEVDSALSSVAIDFFKENVLFVELAKNIAILEARSAKLRAQYMADSPDVRYISEQLTESRKKILEAIVTYAKGLESGIAAREQQKRMNDQLIDETAAEQSATHALLAKYARLKNDFEVAQKHLELLQQQRIDALSSQIISQEIVTISKLDAASVPDRAKPIVPRTGIYTAVAFAVSLLLGVALAFLADHFDHTLRSSAEAERFLGVPVLGSVKRRGRRLIVPG